MDQSPTQCLKSGPPRRRDRDWRSARLLAPTALALQTRKTAMKKTPMHRLAVVSYLCSFHVHAQFPLPPNPASKLEFASSHYCASARVASAESPIADL